MKSKLPTSGSGDSKCKWPSQLSTNGMDKSRLIKLLSLTNGEMNFNIRSTGMLIAYPDLYNR